MDSESVSDHYEIEIDPELIAELATQDIPHEMLVGEAAGYLDDPDNDQMSVARMYIDRGFSEDLAYWLVRAAAVHRDAP